MVLINGNSLLMDFKVEMGVYQCYVLPVSTGKGLSFKGCPKAFKGHILTATNPKDSFGKGLVELGSQNGRPKPNLNPKKREKPEQEQFTVSYLVGSCGLSLESAKSVSKVVTFGTPERADSVVNVLKVYGFTTTHISKLVRVWPFVLLTDPEKTLLPKLEFFHSIGVPHNDLPKMICSTPALLSRSLENNLMPCYELLKIVLVHDEKVVKCLKHSARAFRQSMLSDMVQNLALLRELGAPQSFISYLVVQSLHVASLAHTEFSRLVREIEGMGFYPSKSTFVLAILVKAQITESTWEFKKELYRRWGLTDNEILLGFKRSPFFMLLSEKKIMGTMDFLVNKLGWQPSAVARLPSVLLYSLEKRIIPRCLVVRVLQLKGLIKTKVGLCSVLQYKDNAFLHKFVIEYQEKEPQLLSIFEGKIGLSDLGYMFEEKSEATIL